MNRNQILSILAIILVSLFALYPSFKLALLGDDWLAFFRYAQHLGPKSPGAWNHLTYFLTPYGAQDIMMGLLQKIYNFDSFWYYFISYVLRLIASFSFFPLVYYLTHKKIAAFFAVLFFSVTVIGLDTTNWSSNMTTYITITLFNLFLYFFLKSRQSGKSRLFIAAAFFYYIAYVTTPIRMHGSLPFIFLLELFYFLQNRNLKVFKKICLRVTIVIAIFVLIKFSGSSLGPSNEPIERLTLGVTTSLSLLNKGRFDFLFYPIIMFGGMIMPDFILPSIPVVSIINLFFLILIPAFIVFLILSFFLTKTVSSRAKLFNQIAVLGIIWNIVVIVVNQTNLNTFSDSRYILLLLIGGYFLIISALFINNFFKQKAISEGLFLGLVWSFLSFFFAWWWVPTSIFPTTYRYLAVSAVGISILLATLISLGKERKQQLLLFNFFCLLLIVHIISMHIYFNFLNASHGQEITTKIWGAIPKIPEIGKSKQPIIFYFEGDGTNESILHDIITFGFPPHMALLYGLREENPLPIPMSSWQEVVSAIKDGKTLPAYGYPISPTTLDHIYAFHLQGKDILLNITEPTRMKLQQYSQINNSPQ